MHVYGLAFLVAHRFLSDLLYPFRVMLNDYSVFFFDDLVVEVEFKAVVLIVLPSAVVPFNMNRLLWLVCCCAQLREE